MPDPLLPEETSPGFTLLELLVAMAIFTFLGGTLAFFLHQGLSSWREGESRRAVYEEAHQVLDRLSRDLRSLFTRPAPVQPEGFTEAALWLVPDARGRQRMFFVRTITGESEDPVLGSAGDALLPSGVYDQEADRDEVLRPGGGLMEVAWILHERTLWRAVRAPVGGWSSLGEWFLDPQTAEEIAERARPLSDRVLHFEIRLWGPWTTTWDAAVPPAIGGESGPLLAWDSTRGELPVGLPGGAGRFTTQLPGSSRGDATDDLFPRKALIVVVIEEMGPGATVTWLAKAVSPAADRLELESSAGFPTPEDGWTYALVGDEWVRYDRIDGDTLVLSPGGRGLRGTEAVEHNVRKIVRPGRTFVKVIDIPAARDDWR